VEITAAAKELRNALQGSDVSTRNIIDVLDRWGRSLDDRDLGHIAGVPFLRAWLRRSTLEAVLARELGENALEDGRHEVGRATYSAFPVGIVGHWPAGNVEIQPVLSMSCALLGGNATMVRVPSGLVESTQQLLEKLFDCDSDEVLTRRIFLAAFDHGRQDLHEAIARVVDGAMIWGGREAVLSIRSLPFPYWTKLAVFGPRISVAAMDAEAWGDPATREAWCQRIARDVWQFDQQACSSPQVLFLERSSQNSAYEFLQALGRAFEHENKIHPRQAIAGNLTSAICQARAEWLLKDVTHQAIFPASPDWTLLLGDGSDISTPIQGKTLVVLEVDDLLEPISKFDGNVQTLGLAMSDMATESKLAEVAARRGVDRIVKIGQMHVFTSPWDGGDLVRPMVRIVRHIYSFN
jgi:hypothetical protein